MLSLLKQLKNLAEPERQRGLAQYFRIRMEPWLSPSGNEAWLGMYQIVLHSWDVGRDQEAAKLYLDNSFYLKNISVVESKRC